MSTPIKPNFLKHQAALNELRQRALSGPGVTAEEVQKLIAQMTADGYAPAVIRVMLTSCADLAVKAETDNAYTFRDLVYRAFGQETLEDAVWTLWRRCLVTAREEGRVAAEAVQKLILQSRELTAEHGGTKQDTDRILFTIYTVIHWDWNQHTDRVFETLLDFELDEFFRERMDISDAPHLS